jgi:hypothetical protein
MLSIAKEIQRWITKRLANIYSPNCPLSKMADILTCPLDEQRNNKSVDTHTTITDLHRQYPDTGLRRYTFPDHNFGTRLQYYMIHVTNQSNISDVQRQ